MSDALPIPFLPDVIIEPLVRLALAEDLGRGGDITTDAVIPASARTVAILGAREGGVAAGYDAARLALRLIDPAATWTTLVEEGARFEKGAKLARIEGTARSVLMAERVMLNFIGPLSGVATLTSKFVAEAAGTKVHGLHTSALQLSLLVEREHLKELTVRLHWELIGETAR